MNPARRADIQAMRGVAVLLVLAYHAFPQAVPAGFVGVDVFFVISGWLITGLIVAAQDEGRFSAARFWANRVKRLLPAAYAVIAITIAGSWLVLAGMPLTEFGRDILGALSFTLNFSLAGRQNYFAPAAEFSPLLHLWSLAVEEQFYLFLPPLLMIVPRRWRWRVLAGTLIVSAGVRLTAWQWTTPSESFFLPYTRAWQLALGGLGWMLSRRFGAPVRGAGAASVSLALVIVALALDDGGSIGRASDFHPGMAASLASLAALVMLWLRADAPWRSPVAAPLIWTGNVSYALYLVHWPVLSLYRAAQYDSDIALTTAGLLAGASLAIAALLHYTIERPLHRAPLRRPWFAFVLALVAAVPLAAAGWAASSGAARHVPDSRNFFADGCRKGGGLARAPDCVSGAEARTVLIGDSLAAHLRPAFANVPLIQATRPACAPALGVKQRFEWETSRTAAQCLAWMDSVVAELDGDVRTAVLAGGWSAGWRARSSEEALFVHSGGGHGERALRSRSTDRGCAPYGRNAARARYPRRAGGSAAGPPLRCRHVPRRRRFGQMDAAAIALRSRPRRAGRGPPATGHASVAFRTRGGSTGVSFRALAMPGRPLRRSLRGQAAVLRQGAFFGACFRAVGRGHRAGSSARGDGPLSPLLPCSESLAKRPPSSDIGERAPFPATF